MHHANFVNVPKKHFFRRYWTFTQPIDVFTYELVNGVMVISMCGGTSSDRQILRIVLQDNMTASSLTTSHKKQVSKCALLTSRCTQTTLSVVSSRFWNIVCPIHQGWNFSTPLNSVPPFVVATAVDQPEVQAMLLHLRYPLWFRNRMTMGCVMNLYGINRDDNAGNTPTPMCPFELFPQ
jgi:hypothetical protein